jgi:hypothetical protein
MSTSELQNPSSNMSWIGIEILIILTVDISAFASFLLSFQFHLAVQQSKGEAMVPGRSFKNCTVVSLFILFLLHIILFTISGILLAAGQGDNIAFVASASYVVYKLFISSYFFWGHWTVYKIFKTVDKGRAKSRDISHHIGRRLGLISLINLASLILAMMFALPAISQFNNGWVLLLWMSTLMGGTSFLEVLAVPTGDFRRKPQFAAEMSPKHSNHSKTVVEERRNFFCPVGNWTTKSTNKSTSAVVEVQPVS